MDKIKVVWICSFSNPEMRKRVQIKVPWLIKTICRFCHLDVSTPIDTAIWNTNALAEICKFPQIDLHVITPVRYMVMKSIEYEEKGIHYHFFREQNSSPFRWILFQTFTKYSCQFHNNRKCIKAKISEINPQIVHLMGAENPFYSKSILDVPESICTIAQLQALLCSIENDSAIRNNEHRPFHEKGIIEKQIIKQVDYVGTRVQNFISYIRKEVKPDVKFLPMTLAMAQDVDLNEYEKLYDFVYFSVDIRKACDDAIEAFAIALKRKPNLTLDIVGGYSNDFKEKLDARIKELGIKHAVIFEGKLPTHDDVIRQIKKSRYALLPLKKDIVPSTIREAMSSGLPVVTTVTDGTPHLNEKSDCVLLSDYLDYQAMADNMIKLTEDNVLAETLRQNGASYMREKYNNYDIVAKWVECYALCVNNQL